MKWKAGIVEGALMLGLAVLFAGCEGLSVRKDLDRSVRLYEQGRLEAAEARLLRAIETSPDEARLWHVLAVVYSGQGRLEEARDCHLKTIELEPEEPLWQVGLGIVCHNLRDPGAAEAAFQAALSIDPNCAPAYYYLGRLRADQGQEEEAQNLYKQAMRVQPGYRPAWEMLSGKKGEN